MIKTISKIKLIMSSSILWSYTISFVVTVFFLFDRIKGLSFSKIWYHYGYCFNYYLYKIPVAGLLVSELKFTLAKRYVEGDAFYTRYHYELAGLLKSFFLDTIFLSLVLWVMILYFVIKTLKHTTINNNEDTGLLTSLELAKKLKEQNMNSWLQVGEMPLVKDLETSHILITGIKGSGKTNLLHTLLPQIRSKHQPAIIVDQTGELISNYYDAARGDIIFNPFDERSQVWDFWKDIEQEGRLDILVNTIFANTDLEDTSSAKTLFEKTINTCRTIMSCKEFYDSLVTAATQPSNVEGKKKNTKISMPFEQLRWLKILQDTDNNFSIQDFLQENKGAWLFITTTKPDQPILNPLHSIFLDLAFASLMSLNPSFDRRFWFVIDEFENLKKLTFLTKNIAELKKYGGCILATLSSISNMNEYNNFESQSLIKNFATHFMFKNNLKDLDGIFNQKQKIITEQNIANLKNLECYLAVKHPELSVALLETKIVDVKNEITAFIQKDKMQNKENHLD